MSRWLLALLLCSSFGVHAAEWFVGNLDGGEEVPPAATAAVGFGRVTLDPGAASITVSVEFSGLAAAQTAAHIHGPAAPGVNAGVLFNLGTVNATSGTLGPLSFAVTPQQMDDLRAGLWYFNVHSSAFPGGEIRGQIVVDAGFSFALDGSQEVPPAATAGLGEAFVSLNEAEDRLVISLAYSGLASVANASHLHSGVFGVNGPVVVSLGDPGDQSGGFTDLFLVAPLGLGDALRDEAIYLNIHSMTFPGGEIRGQAIWVDRIFRDGYDQ